MPSKWWALGLSQLILLPAVPCVLALSSQWLRTLRGPLDGPGVYLQHASVFLLRVTWESTATGITLFKNMGSEPPRTPSHAGPHLRGCGLRQHCESQPWFLELARLQPFLSQNLSKALSSRQWPAALVTPPVQIERKPLAVPLNPRPSP